MFGDLDVFVGAFLSALGAVEFARADDGFFAFGAKNDDAHGFIASFRILYLFYGIR